jgi:hypothetical protein
MICTSAREPLIISLVRSSIGCEIEKKVEGTALLERIFEDLAEAVEVVGGRPLLLGRRRTRMSLLSLPTGSIATSARPVIASVVITSGNRTGLLDDEVEALGLLEVDRGGAADRDDDVALVDARHEVGALAHEGHARRTSARAGAEDQRPAQRSAPGTMRA